MSMYDSNTNVRTKTSTRNRSLAQAENFLFKLFMAGAVALTIYVVDTPEADDGPVTAEAVAASTLEDLYSPIGGAIAVINMVYAEIYGRVSAYFIDAMNFKYQHEFDSVTTNQVDYAMFTINPDASISTINPH